MKHPHSSPTPWRTRLIRAFGLALIVGAGLATSVAISSASTQATTTTATTTTTPKSTTITTTTTTPKTTTSKPAPPSNSSLPTITGTAQDGAC